MILTSLDRTTRNATIKSFVDSPKVAACRTFLDYYRGVHFVRSAVNVSDYAVNQVFRVTTRSGTELYDEAEAKDKTIVKSNWCAPIIDVVADYTRGVAEPLVVNSEVKEDELRLIWKKSKLDILIHRLAYKSGIYGEQYLRLRQLLDKSIFLSSVDATNVVEVRNEITDELESLIFWTTLGVDFAKRRFPTVQGIQSTGFVVYCEEWSNEQLYKYVDGVVVNDLTTDLKAYKDVNPYGFIPFFKTEANVFCDSDLKDVLSLNDDLNITYTYINEIFKYAAFPMLAPKGTFSETTPVLTKAQLQEVEISPRTILPIPMEKLKGEGVDQSVIDHVAGIQKDISVVSGVPIKVLTAELDGNMSGVALERMLSTVIKKAEKRRVLIQDTVQSVNNAILKLLGVNVTDDVDTELVFPDMVKIDTNERLDEAIKKQTLGISQETILDELGYDYEEEKKKRASELDNEQTNKLNNELSTSGEGKQDQGAGPQKRTSPRDGGSPQ